MGRVGQCRASSRMRMRCNCDCTQCPSSDIHLRLAFPLAVCINSIRKPLATQTIYFKVHPYDTADLTDNNCLIRGKHIGYISNMESLPLSLPFLQTGSSNQKLPKRFTSSSAHSYAKARVLIVSWPENQARTWNDPCHDRIGPWRQSLHI